MKFIFILTFLLACSLQAQNLAFDPIDSKGSLYEYAEFTNTANRDLTFDEVIQNKYLEFSPLTSENHSLGFTSDEYWVRFQLKNSTETIQTYYLETARPITDIVNLYQEENDGIKIFRSGDQLPFDERQVKHRLSIFKITLAPLSTTAFHLQTSSDGETINLPLQLYSQDEFFNANYKQQLFLGLFYGLLFLAGLIYMFFYSSLKEGTFLYYSLYVFSIACLQAALDGFIYQYFLPEGGYLNSRMVLITALLSNFFLLKYCELFLKIQLRLPAFKKVYNLIYGVLAFLFLMIFMSPQTLEMAYPISNVNGLISLLLILTSLFTLRHKRLEVDRYFSIGIFFLVLGLLGFVLNNLSLLPNNFYTLNSSKFGSALKVIFLSLSMTNLIRSLRLEKETSQELALKKSEEISQFKTYFMSNISHELRTPINAIMGVVQEQLSKDKVSLEHKESYEIIKNASYSLLSNVNDVIDFECIEKNELTLRNQKFEPVPLLQQMSDNWQHEAEKKGLKYTFQLDADIPEEILGDPDRFAQIVNNVLGNAVKFTHQGSIMFKLKCSNQPNDVNLFSIQISDTGIGMDKSSKEEVFSSFNQMRFNHSRQFGGIGLGLTIVKHLVDLFLGTITIESELNKGTGVFIELPFKITKKLTSTHEQDNTPTRVLVVEDNKMNQLVLCKMLDSATNISYKTVENGLEALEELKQSAYDLILMDLQMPIMDGYEATEKIRKGIINESTASIPIIAVTADATEKARSRVLEIGMNDYTTKPVNKEVLLGKINNCRPLFSNTKLKVVG